MIVMYNDLICLIRNKFCIKNLYARFNTMPNHSIVLPEIGARIRSLRKACNKTQTYFADLLYISPSYLALIESGKRAPSIEILAHISNICDVSVDYILFGNAVSLEDTNKKIFQRITSVHSPKDVEKALKLTEYYLTLEHSDS